MNPILLCAVLAVAVPASSQVFFDVSQVARVRDGARSLGERLAPAAVEPEPVSRLFERLAKDGQAVESEVGMQDMYQRFGRFDAEGKMRNIQVGVVELPDPADEDDAPMARHAVYRRYFSHLLARNEDFSVRRDGHGRVDAWDWTVSLDGKLLSVTHTILPLAPSAGGRVQIVEEKVRAYRMSPSDPAVQRRWRRVVTDLLTLGRTVEA